MLFGAFCTWLRLPRQISPGWSHSDDDMKNKKSRIQFTLPGIELPGHHPGARSRRGGVPTGKASPMGPAGHSLKRRHGSVLLWMHGWMNGCHSEIFRCSEISPTTQYPWELVGWPVVKLLRQKIRPLSSLQQLCVFRSMPFFHVLVFAEFL